MIRCDIHIEFVDDGTHKGMSIAVDPRPVNEHREESVAWIFLNIGIQCALDRIKEQMAPVSQNSDELVTGLASRDIMKERMEHLGVGKRLTASFAISWHPAGGLIYTLIRVPNETLHNLEAAAWGTLKTALDFTSDFFDSDGFGASYEDDKRNLREALEEKLAAMPVFEKP